MTDETIYEDSSEDIGELIGGLKNAMDNGDDISKARQSFLNAGYTKKEVDDAAAALGIVLPNQPSSTIVTQKVTPISPVVEKPIAPQTVAAPQEKTQKLPTLPAKQPLPIQAAMVQPKFVSPLPSKGEVQKLPTAEFREPQPLNKTLVAILILLGIVFVVLAGFLGIYWEQLFGPF